MDAEINISLDGAAAAAQIDALKKKIENLERATGQAGNGMAKGFDKAATSTDKMDNATKRAIKSVSTSINNANKAFTKQKEIIERTTASVALLQQRLSSLTMPTLSGGGANTANMFSGVHRQISLADAAMQRFHETSRSVLLTLRTLGTALSVGWAFNQLAQFEQGMASVKAITQATTVEIAAMREQAKELGATTRYTAGEAAEGMTFLAKSGLKANEILTASADVLVLAQAGGLGLAEASDVAVKALRGFKLEASEMGNVADILATAANASTLSVHELGEAYKFVGPISASLNVDLQTTTAALSVLANAGITASMGGTALRRIMSELQNPTIKATKFLSTLGLSLNDVDVSVHGLIPVLQTLMSKNISVGESFKLFGDRGAPAFEVLRNNMPTLLEMNAKLGDVEGAAKRTAKVMDENLYGSFKAFMSSIENLVIGLSDTSGLTTFLSVSLLGLATAFRALEEHANLAFGAMSAFVAAKLVLYYDTFATIIKTRLVPAMVAYIATVTAAAASTGLLSAAALALKTIWPLLVIPAVIGGLVAYFTRTSEAEKITKKFGLAIDQVEKDVNGFGGELVTTTTVMKQFTEEVDRMDKAQLNLSYDKQKESLSNVRNELQNASVQFKLFGGDLKDNAGNVGLYGAGLHQAQTEVASFTGRINTLKTSFLNNDITLHQFNAGLDEIGDSVKQPAMWTFIDQLKKMAIATLVAQGRHDELEARLLATADGVSKVNKEMNGGIRVADNYNSSMKLASVFQPAQWDELVQKMDEVAFKAQLIGKSDFEKAILTTLYKELGDAVWDLSIDYDTLTVSIDANKLAGKLTEEQTIRLTKFFKDLRAVMNDKSEQKGLKRANSEANKRGEAIKKLNEELSKFDSTKYEKSMYDMNAKVADFEKTLGKGNKQVAEFKTKMTKKIDTDWLKELIKDSDKSAAAVNEVKEEYKKWIKEAERLKTIDPALYNELLTKRTKEYTNALRDANAELKLHNEFKEETQTIVAEATYSSAEKRAYDLNLKMKKLREENVYTAVELDERMNAELLLANKSYTGDMTKLFDQMYEDISKSGADMIYNWLETGKVSFNDFKSYARRMLAEIANMYLVNPIIMPIVGQILNNGQLSIKDGQFQAGGGGGGLSNLPFGSLIPDEWKDSITNTVKGTLQEYLPSIFGSGVGTAPNLAGASFFSGAGSSLVGNIGSNGIAALPNMGGISFFSGTGSNLAGGALPGGVNAWSSGMQLGATPGGGMAGGGVGNFAQGINPGLLYGAGGSLVGGMASPYINDMLGIANNKEAEIGTIAGGAVSSTLMAIGAANGWNPGGWAIMAIAALSSIFGGAGGGLIGGKPKRPAIWAGTEMDLGNPDAMKGYDFTETFDPKGYGKEDYWSIDSGHYAVASRARNKASGKLEGQFANVLKEVAEAGVTQADALKKALPEKYVEEFNKNLSANRFYAEWDFKGDDINEDSFKQAAEELVAKMNDAMLRALQATDFSEYEGKIDIDTSSLAGFEKFTNAVKLIGEVDTATEDIGKYVSQFEQEANAANTQLNTWIESLKSYGVTAEYAKEKTDEYRTAMINNYIKVLDDSLNPLSEFAQAQKTANDAVDERIAALKILGATEEQIATVEGMRSKVLENALEPMQRAFSQESRTREANLTGNKDLVASTQMVIEHENELIEVRKKYGLESAEYAKTQALQARELAKLHREAAKEFADAITAMNNNLSLRWMELAGDTQGAASLNMEIRHKQELEDARTEAISITERLLLQAKADRLNVEEGTTKWTPELLLKTFTDLGITIKEWYTRYGVGEGFGNIGAGYNNTPYEDDLRDVQKAEREALKLANNLEDANEALRIAAEEASNLQNAYNIALQNLNDATSKYNSIKSEIEGLVRSLKNFADAVKDAADALDKARRDLWQGEDNLSMSSRVEATQVDFDRLYDLAMGGDVDAAKELAGMGSTLLDLYKETSRNSEEYYDAFFDVDRKLRMAHEVALKEYNMQMSQYDALMKEYALQETQAKTQAEILARLGDLRTELANASQAVKDAQAAADAARIAAEAAAARERAAQAARDAAAEAARKAAEEAAKRPPAGGGGSTGGGSSGGGSTGGGGGTVTPPPVKPPQPRGPFNGWFESEVVDRKIRNLSAHKEDGNAHWTATDFYNKLRSNGLSGFGEWWTRWGQYEFEVKPYTYAKGGITPASSWAGRQTPFITGEKGPELVVSPQSYGVLNSKTSAALLQNLSNTANPINMYNKGDDSGTEEEVRQLRNDIKVLTTIITRMALHLKETNDVVQEASVDGWKERA